MMMEGMTINMKNIWLNQELNSNTLTLREDFFVSNLFNCFIGRIGASNAKMFQIEINKGTIIQKNYLKRFHGVEIRVLDSKNDKKDITIILSDNDLIDVFILFLEDLIKNLATIKDENKIPIILNKKVVYWGKLFAKLKGKFLTKERQRGLYGELAFLNSLLNSSNDFESTISLWTGPEGSNQDFVNGLCAVEIKSSRATNPRVNIANELQLDWTKLDNLYLHVIHLDELNNGSDTLKKLVDVIKYKIKNHPNLLRLFEEKLDLVGIPFGEEKYYDEVGFIIRSQKTYEVQDGFPVLINDNIKNDAIHNVKYQIDISACKQFELNTNLAISKLLSI